MERRRGGRGLRRSRSSTTWSRSCGACADRAAGLPFDFDCGFAGYLGYELKADCDGDAAHRVADPRRRLRLRRPPVAFDHLERRTYLLCLTEPDERGVRRRLAGSAGDEPARWRSLPPLRQSPGRRERRADGEPVEFPPSAAPASATSRTSPPASGTCSQGESYEICLTNKVVAEAAPDPLLALPQLRRVNPAPFAAFLRFGDLAVLSSSPERFLARRSRRPGRGEADQGHRAAAARPPARTRAWRRRWRADEKSRAENVTIVDLLRNDLGIVCEVGTRRRPGADGGSRPTRPCTSSSRRVRGRLREEVGPARAASAPASRPAR